MTSSPDADKLVRVHQKIAAARSKLKKDFETADEALKEQQQVVEGAMLAFLNETKQKTATTATGLFYWQEKIIPQGADWNAFYAWVAKEGAFEALFKRINVGFIKTYMEEHDKALPPGVKLFREREIHVRKNPKS